MRKYWGWTRLGPTPDKPWLRGGLARRRVGLAEGAHERETSTREQGSRHTTGAATRGKGGRGK